MHERKYTYLNANSQYSIALEHTVRKLFLEWFNYSNGSQPPRIVDQTSESVTCTMKRPTIHENTSRQAVNLFGLVSNLSIQISAKQYKPFVVCYT